MSDEVNSGDGSNVTASDLTGAIRVQFGGAAEAPVPADLGEGVRDSTGTELDLATGRMREHTGFQREQISSESDPSLGILASVRSPGGSRSAPITKHSTVEIPGLGRTTVAAACYHGFLRQDGHGGWVETGKNAQAYVEQVNTPPAETAPAASEGPALVPESEAVVEKIASALPHGMHSAFEHSLMTKGVDATVKAFAAHSTMDTESLRGAAQFVEAAFTAQLAHRLAPQGISVEDFADFVRTHYAAEGRAAMTTQVATRRASAYDSLITKYLEKRGGR